MANKDGWTTLHEAVCRDERETAKLLLKAGESVNVTFNNGKTPLCLAIEKSRKRIVYNLRMIDPNVDLAIAKDYPMIDLLLKAGADVNMADNNGRTPLHWAVDKGNYCMIYMLPKAGADVNMADNMDTTPLCLAAERGHCGTVFHLLNAGADANMADNTCRTALSWAAEKSTWETVYNLLDAGAEANKADTTGRAPLHWAIERDNDKIVYELLKAGAEANLADNTGKTPLHWAIERGTDLIVGYLLKAGAEAHLADIDGWTPLHKAVINDNTEAVKRLINVGANVKATDNLGKSCMDYIKDTTIMLHVAAETRCFELAEFCIQAGVNVDATNDRRETALYVACYNKQPEMINLLLESGADFTIVTDRIQTPFDLLSRNFSRADFVECFVILYIHGAYRSSQEFQNQFNCFQYSIKLLPRILQVIKLSGNHDQDYRHVMWHLHKLKPRYKDQVEESKQQILSLEQSARVVIRRRLCQVRNGKSIWRSIDLLEIAKQLKGYLKMFEFLPSSFLKFVLK